MMLDGGTLVRVQGMTRVGDDGVKRTWNGRVWVCPSHVSCEFCAAEREATMAVEAAS